MKRYRNNSRRRERGVTFVELLVAGLLLSIGLMALVNVWSYSFFVTGKSDDSAIAYNLGRQTIERVKTSGFSSALEGAETNYYDGDQVLQASPAGGRFVVTTNISSDMMQTGTSGQSGGVAGSAALRSVTVSVSSGGTTLYQTSTYLCRAGI
jgi:Tfp pilus assembly protein PilV